MGLGMTTAAEHQEAVGGDAQRDVMVEAAPAAALEVAQADLLLQLAIPTLDPPAVLGGADQLGQRGAGGPGQQPLAGRIARAGRPLDQQHLLFGRAVRGASAATRTRNLAKR